jgi:hypothetical protein
LKEFLIDEGIRLGLTHKTMQNRFWKGWVKVPVRRINRRVIYVQVPNPMGTAGSGR